jgi:hypothetical protein
MCLFLFNFHFFYFYFCCTLPCRSTQTLLVILVVSLPVWENVRQQMDPRT